MMFFEAMVVTLWRKPTQTLTDNKRCTLYEEADFKNQGWEKGDTEKIGRKTERRELPFHKALLFPVCMCVFSGNVARGNF